MKDMYCYVTVQTDTPFFQADGSMTDKVGICFRVDDENLGVVYRKQRRMAHVKVRWYLKRIQRRAKNYQCRIHGRFM